MSLQEEVSVADVAVWSVLFLLATGAKHHQELLSEQSHVQSWFSHLRLQPEVQVWWLAVQLSCWHTWCFVTRRSCYIEAHCSCCHSQILIRILYKAAEMSCSNSEMNGFGLENSSFITLGWSEDWLTKLFHLFSSYIILAFPQRWHFLVVLQNALSNISAKISMVHFSINNPICSMFSCIWKSQAQYVSIKVIN